MDRLPRLKIHRPGHYVELDGEALLNHSQGSGDEPQVAQSHRAQR